MTQRLEKTRILVRMACNAPANYDFTGIHGCTFESTDGQDVEFVVERVIAEPKSECLDDAIQAEPASTSESQLPDAGKANNLQINAHPRLHPHTAELVRNFAQALADKLLAAQEKYGYSDGWMDVEWMDECRDRLREHLAKGDPRDVAAYCAFLWWHGESTVNPDKGDAE